MLRMDDELARGLLSQVHPGGGVVVPDSDCAEQRFTRVSTEDLFDGPTCLDNCFHFRAPEGAADGQLSVRNLVDGHAFAPADPFRDVHVLLLTDVIGTKNPSLDPVAASWGRNVRRLDTQQPVRCQPPLQDLYHSTI